MRVTLKRIYDPAAENDGFRILVDRLWPRGVSREKARIDLWFKDLAPSNELRQWFGHKTEHWEEFRRRYLEELAAAPEAAGRLMAELRGRDAVTLLYGAKDRLHNQAVVLRDFLFPDREQA